MLLHGAAGSWHNFRLQIQWLQARFRVLTLDLRGHGLSPWPGPSSVTDFVDDVAELVEKRIQGDFAVIGHSFGGCLALELAVRMPDRVRGVALLNTAGRIPAGPLYRLLQLCGRFSHWVAQIEPYWLSVHGSVCHQLLWHTLPGWQTAALAPAVLAPCLVLCGRNDSLIPWRESQELARRLPNARFHRIDQGRHVCMWEHPKVVQEQLGLWLGDLQWPQ